MTEAQWLNCGDPDHMLRFLGGRAPLRSGLLGWLRRDGGQPEPLLPWPVRERKLLLLACAYCRRIADLMVDERSRRAVEIAELHAVGAASDAELLGAREEARAAYNAILARGNVPHLPALYVRPGEPTWAWIHAAQAALAVTSGELPVVHSAFRAAAMVIAADFDDLAWAAAAAGAAAQVAVIRDIFGNPFREVPVQPSWLRWNDGTVPRIAQGIYEDYRFTDLPVLHDALLDAGCDDEDVLAHCRESGPHVRGCWVIDLLLGKE
jgi:hypothetical protein